MNPQAQLTVAMAAIVDHCKMFLDGTGVAPPKAILLNSLNEGMMLCSSLQNSGLIPAGAVSPIPGPVIDGMQHVGVIINRVTILWPVQ